MNFRSYILVLIFLVTNFLTAQEEISIAKRYKLDSKVLNEERTYSVYLPYNYDPNDMLLYPVMYVLDGQYLSPLANEIARILSESSKIPKVITVGIENLGNNRDRDFTPPQTANSENKTNLSAKEFLDFVDKELRPAIESNYRTAPYTILIGHSLGGTFALYSMLKSSNFDSYILIDPNYKYYGQNFETDLNDFLEHQNKDNITFYLSHEKKDYSNYGVETLTFLKNIQQYQEDAFENNLKERFIEEESTDHRQGARFRDTKMHLQYKFEHREDENHNSLPIRSIKNGLLFTFRDFRLDEFYSFEFISNISKNKVDEMVNHFQYLNDKYDYDIGVESSLDRSARIMFSLPFKNTHESALYALQRNTELYPNSAKAYYHLANIYQENGEDDNAVKNYKKAIKLSQKNNNEEILESSKKQLNILKE